MHNITVIWEELYHKEVQWHKIVALVWMVCSHGWVILSRSPKVTWAVFVEKSSTLP